MRFLFCDFFWICGGKIGLEKKILATSTIYGAGLPGLHLVYVMTNTAGRRCSCSYSHNYCNEAPTRSRHSREPQLKMDVKYTRERIAQALQSLNDLDKSFLKDIDRKLAWREARTRSNRGPS
jgi:hypothetical protein